MAAVVAAVAAPPAAAQFTPPPSPPPQPPPRPGPAPPIHLTPLPGPVSREIGVPWCGTLVAGVPLAAAGSAFFTWDMPSARSPSPQWRRYGTARLVALVRRVAAADRRAYPRAGRLGIADLSLPRGGPFGPRYGGLGHLSHQNGLDVDVLYPRRDGSETPPVRGSDIDLPRAQALVDRFVAAGAERVFVGVGLGLKGPRPLLAELAHHQDHMHVRIAPAWPVRAPRRCPWRAM